MLTQKSRNNPVLTNLTNNELISKITAALRDANVGLPTRPHTPDSEGNGGEEQLMPCVH